jgi:hypothetical protein
VSGVYCDVKPNICMKKDQKVVQRPVPDAYEFFWIPFSRVLSFNNKLYPNYYTNSYQYFRNYFMIEIMTE